MLSCIGHAGSGARLLICNGSGATLDRARPLLDLLATEFDLLAWDYRGLGRSAALTSSYGMADVGRRHDRTPRACRSGHRPCPGPELRWHGRRPGAHCYRPSRPIARSGRRPGGRLGLPDATSLDTEGQTNMRRKAGIVAFSWGQRPSSSTSGRLRPRSVRPAEDDLPRERVAELWR